MMEERWIDLRSDTVTKPTPAMRDAMANAEVGDDQYGEDPTVTRLEARAAELVGKEAAVYVPSGTMGNLAALLAHAGRGEEVILGDESHIFWYESGGPATLGGMPTHLVRTFNDGTLDLDHVAKAIRIKRPGYPRTAVICIENTHNRCSGQPIDRAYLRVLRNLANSRDVPIHMDGARIFNAAAAFGTTAADLAAEVDSIQFCLSKALAAPVGSIVAGSAEFITKVRTQRKLLGGAMRQSGVIAAAGLVALDEMIDRWPEDHHRAKTLAEGLASVPGLEIDPESVRTNIVIFRIPTAMNHVAAVAAFAEQKIRVSDYGTRGLRMVTHYEIDDTAIERAIAAAQHIFAPVPA